MIGRPVLSPLVRPAPHKPVPMATVAPTPIPAPMPMPMATVAPTQTTQNDPMRMAMLIERLRNG